MKNPPGLIHIETGGSASTTKITIDDVVPMVKRATIIIDPEEGENQIKLHCFSRQNNRLYEDGKVQSFHGISAENYEFFKGLMEVVSKTSDFDLDHELSSGKLSPDVYHLLKFIYDARHQGQPANEPDSEQS